MIAAANNTADLMIQMSKFNKSVLKFIMLDYVFNYYRHNKDEFIQKSKDIVRESKQIVKIANKVCEAATDYKGLKTVSLSNNYE